MIIRQFRLQFLYYIISLALPGKHWNHPSCDLSPYVNKFCHVPHVDVPPLNCVTGAILHNILHGMEDFDGHVGGKWCHRLA